MRSHVPTKIVNIVIDSLDVRMFRRAAPAIILMRHADVWRRKIADFEPGDPETYVQLPGLGTFRLKMGGRPPYEFVLINPQICDIRIWNVGRWHTKSAAQTGQFYVSFRSVFMQRHGLDGVRRVLRQIEDLFCVDGDVHHEALEPWDRVARVDLAVDTQESREMVWGDLDRFVCRARKLDTWTHVTPANIEELLKLDLSAGNFLPMEAPEGDEALPRFARSASRVLRAFMTSVVQELETHGEAELSRVVSHNRKPQTVYFGRFGSPLYARRYNKLGSLVVQNKLFMVDVWKAGGWDGDSPVLRTEFSLSGDFLKNYRLHQDGVMIEDCRDLCLLEHVVPGLWDYLVTDWLSMRDVQDSDSNYRRWPVSASWSLLVGAFGTSDLAASRDHSRTVPKDDRHLLDQSHGCAVSTVALRASVAGDVEAARQSVLDDFMYEISSDDFIEKVLERRREYGLDEFSDTALSATIRQERMFEGVGS